MSDLISRQAAIDALKECREIYCDNTPENFSLLGHSDKSRVDEIDNAIAILVNLPSAQRWIPVKTRTMDEEERAEWSEKLGYDIEYEYAVIFECPMPEDGQEILVSYRKWVSIDKCEICSDAYGLEGNGDWEGVVAWMPLPEPWKGDQE